MPIVLNSATNKKKDCTTPAHDSSRTRSTRSRRTLSTGSLRQLKKEVEASLQQNQHQDCHDGNDRVREQQPFPFGNDYNPSSSSSPPTLPASHSTLGPRPNIKHQGLISSDCPPGTPHRPTLPQHIETKAGLLVTTQQGRAFDTTRGSQEEREGDDLDPCICQMKRRGRERGTPSPSQSPPPSSPSPFANGSMLHLLHLTSSASFLPLSPPASATTALPPPCILSAMVALSQHTSPPEIMNAEETSSAALDMQQSQLEDDASVGRTTNSARSSPPPLASSLWQYISERRGSESRHEEPRTKRRRSMVSPGQSLSPAEYDEQSRRGCPLPRSATSSASLPAEPRAVTENVSEERKFFSETGYKASETASAQRRSSSHKPALSYAELISQVLLESNKIKMTLAEIYASIMHNHPYYRHAASGWQNSIRHCLSLNTAFSKVDRTVDEPGKGCFWALRKDGNGVCHKAPCRKRKGPEDDSSSDPVTPPGAAARSKVAPLPRLDYLAETSSELLISSDMPLLESAPSPAASEDADDMKGPRRSGRARRPPRPKEAEEYVAHVRHPSLTGAALSTPPSSPAPHGQDNEVNPVAALARKRAGSVKVERSAQGTVVDIGRVQSNEPAAPTIASNRKGIQDVDLASIPGVVTTQRVRRPPQNLAEFVSSEDFKASPCGKRTLQSSNDALIEFNPRDKKEGRRSKSDGQLVCSASGKSATVAEMDGEHVEARPQQGSLELSASVQDLEVALRLSQTEARPATIPLSALSHSKRDSQDLSCLNPKKQRRNAGNSNSRQFPSRQEILERRRRNGKREIMVASEDDWSDSDFDFLRDEQENYRLMRIRARRTQRARGWWSRCGKDEEEVEDGYVDVTSEDDNEIERENLCHAEGEKMKLLMDPSVINYGFDSLDGEYILDYHQGPLFNNVTWPEFSDVKEDSSSAKSINSNNTINNSNAINGDAEEVELCTISDAEIAAAMAATDSGVVAEAHVHMEGDAVVQVVNAGAKENKEEIEAEDYIGWSLCE